MTPAVSVCIPAYRGGELLGRTIESVLAQTYADFELLIVDDRSPDNTLAVAQRHGRDPRVRVMQNPLNLGPEGNWTRCLAEARGRYVKLLPQDDLIAPTLLARQVDVFESDREGAIALVFCARHIVDANDRVIMSKGLRRGLWQRPSGRIAGPALVRASVRAGTNLIGEPGGVMFRKSLAERVGKFDASIGYIVDLDYWTRLLRHGDGHYQADRLASFRVSGGSWSVSIGRGQAAAFNAFVDRLARDPGFGISRFDRACGKLMARANNLARLLVYRFFIAREAGMPSAVPPLPPKEET